MRHSWVRIAILIALFLGAGLYPADRDVVAAVQRGDHLVQERHYSAALAAYAWAGERYPGSALPHLRQGEVYLVQGRHEEAWSAYLRALTLGADDEAREGLWPLYRDAGDFALAIETVERILAHAPERGDLWAVLGTLSREAGEPEAVVQAFARALALEIDPLTRQSVHDQWGTMVIESDPATALAQFRQVVLGPDVERAGHASKLIAALEAWASSDDMARSRAKIGQVLLQRGDLALACRQFEIAVALQDDYVDGHAYLGHILSTLREFEKAEEHIERALALQPEYPLALYFAGMHYARKGWLITGREILLQAHDLDPKDPGICAAVADTYLRAGQSNFGAAEHWLHAAVDRAPEDVRFHLLLAHFYVDYGIDPSLRGVAVSQVAVQLAPQNSEALETLGWAYHLGNHPRAALEPMLRAEKLDPYHPRLQYRLGEIYRALGQTDNAIAAYQQAIAEFLQAMASPRP